MQAVISRDGTQIAYDQVGQGPAVILVAGAFSYRKYPASVQLADLLAQHFTVFNYDRRGRGDSGDTKPYTVEREIEDIQTLSLLVYPLVLGKGRRLFQDGSQARLKLVNAHSFRTGIVLLQYQSERT